MMRATGGKDKPKGISGRPRFPGICEAAEALGVDRSHLYRVLTGERESRRLTRAWSEWQRQREEAAR